MTYQYTNVHFPYFFISLLYMLKASKIDVKKPRVYFTYRKGYD